MLCFCRASFLLHFAASLYFSTSVNVLKEVYATRVHVKHLYVGYKSAGVSN